jgi:hypothetical protein
VKGPELAELIRLLDALRVVRRAFFGPFSDLLIDHFLDVALNDAIAQVEEALEERYPEEE